MKHILFLAAFLPAVLTSRSQTIPQKLATAMAALEADAQMKHAIIGFCVVDTKTGKPVYEHNSEVGLAPASTQKLFTSAAALELLGKDYRYKTDIVYKAGINKDSSFGFFFIKPCWDPTFGSWRYATTRPDKILENIAHGLEAAGIRKAVGHFKYGSATRNDNTIPRGWIWEDIGNYYGAAPHLLNWLENKYDIILRSGKQVGDPVEEVGQYPPYSQDDFELRIKSAARGSGDNAYIFLMPPYGKTLIEGTIPVGEDSFSISGSIPAPVGYFEWQLQEACAQKHIKIESGVNEGVIPEERLKTIPLLTHYSPTLDSINYWFLRRSINLYGEALVRTLAYEKAGAGATDNGVELVRDFWQANGIERSAIHLVDGSGLSPQNRVTTEALVKVLQYAKTRSWYSSFYNALPQYNGMKMKSGSIGGARAFAGYHTAKDGKEYTYAIIVNNYDGSAGEAVKKIYRLLDVLKGGN